MTKTRNHWLAAAILTLTPIPTFAHPLHGSGDFVAGLMHPFVGLDHLLAMFMIGAFAGQRGGHALWRVPLVFTGVMAAGAALGFTGSSVAVLEPLLAASVLAIALLVLNAARVSVVYGVMLASAFAFLHGAAHGAEMPAGASIAAYAAGFVLATATLMCAGVFTALASRGRDTLLRLAAAPVALTGAWLLAIRLA